MIILNIPQVAEQNMESQAAIQPTLLIEGLAGQEFTVASPSRYRFVLCLK